MEPMNLGSAPSSPSSPTANPNFLPAFLMGETQQTPGLTPTRSNVARKTPTMSTTPSRMFMDSPIPKHKPGPPNQSLFDALDENRKPTSPILNSTAAVYAESPMFLGQSLSMIPENTFNASHMSNLHESYAQLSRVDKIDTHWVTVFGFPPSALSLVIAQMSSCGTIVEKKIPNQGNWVHLKFQSLGDIPKALALNGRCINNHIMIGVQLHHKQENKENESVFSSPIQARSLRHSFIAPADNNSVIAPQNVPQKSTGIVSKAIEYVFGW